MLNLNFIQYSPATSSLDIFVAGCNPPFCKNCCNPELIDFNNGTPWQDWQDKIEEYIGEFGSMFNNIFLLGGSFNHQNEDDLKSFILFLDNFDKDLWLFAREDIEDIKPIFKQYCSYIKCGSYIPELSCRDNIQYGIDLATSNQYILSKEQF